MSGSGASVRYLGRAILAERRRLRSFPYFEYAAGRSRSFRFRRSRPGKRVWSVPRAQDYGECDTDSDL